MTRLTSGPSPSVAPLRATPSTLLACLELARPLVLLAIFVVVGRSGGWWWSVPFAVASVLAASVLVHDLIHGALALPRGLNDFALGAYALFLIKSGHALRRLHLEHHARCLHDDDYEGSPIYMPTWKLLLKGPWLAIEARALSWKKETSRRWAQAVETALNVAITLALAGAAFAFRAPLPAIYLLSVIVVTVTVPLVGAKVPHLLPEKYPRLVRALRPFATRLTPAASSLLFHELHHRRPRLPAALLPEHRDLLETTEISNCARTYEDRRP